MDFPKTVYEIKHNKTNRSYIGTSKHPENRVYSHLSALRSGRHPVRDMQDDFDAYGEDYTISFLEVIEKYEDRNHEYDWMRKRNSFIRGMGYNYNDHFKQDKSKPNKVTYRAKINELLKQTDDLETLELVTRFWQKLVEEGA